MQISIHALREEGDRHRSHSSVFHKISIHALREEGDCCTHGSSVTSPIFQSTPSARRATNIVCAVGGGLLHFNPRPPWGKRPDKPKTPAPAKQFQSAISTWKATTDKLIVYDEAYKISIHALREEGDFAAFPVLSIRPRFQSTPSARRATEPAGCAALLPVISIHALREEGDYRHP